MGEYSLQEGDQIVLSILLKSRQEDKHVLCHVTTDTGVTLTGSPFTVPHTARALHTVRPPGLNYPVGIDELHGNYIIYNDAGFTEVSSRNKPGFDVWRKAPQSDFSSELQEILNVLNDLLSLVTSVASSAEIVGEVQVEDTLEGNVLDDEVEGFVEESDGIEGFVFDEESITGEVSSEELIGFVEE